MKTLIMGSLAFDTIMVFEDQFKNHILPEQTHILNVSFLVPKMARFQGGCAGNIAYNLKLLGGDPVIMATVGEDFGVYQNWLERHEFNTAHIKTIEGQFTAQAFITTDIDNNQINAFHPGAMSFAHQNKVSDTDGVELAIVGPDGRDAMIEHAAQLAEAGIPFVFDPGQGMPMFDGDDLRRFLIQANYVVVNDYESEMLLDKTGLSLEQLVDQVEVLIITRGASGSEVYRKSEMTHVACAPISEAVDPTGCGDAYRGGLLYGRAQGLDWITSAKLGSVCGAIKIEHSGTQTHKFTRAEFAQRYQAAYSENCPI